jgi:poly-gamma-glutamate synthesis protein (capsule biosynthesis protein)
MLFAGDTMLARAVGDLMAARDDWTWPFVQIASVTAAADLMFVNLETTISTGGAQAGCGYCFRANPNVIEGLTRAGIDVVTLANNHAYDYGSRALADTIVHLASAGIGVTGAGLDGAQARAPVFRTVGSTRVAFLSYTNLLPTAAAAGPGKLGVAIYDSAYLVQDIALAKRGADVVVVSFHAGEEYQTEPNAWQERVYRSAIDAGANLVIGHHPHVVQPVEAYGDGWIAYSLGNFVFDQSFSTATMEGLMLEATVMDGEILDVRELPVIISPAYQPALASDGRVR